MKTAVLVGCVLAAGSAFGVYRMQDSSAALGKVRDVESRSFAGPVQTTAEQRAALRFALANDLPVPPEFVQTEWSGKVKVVDLGEDAARGVRDYIVTIRDDRADLQTATVFINDVAMVTATRENGAIKDLDDVATATLSASAPAHQAFTAKLTWTASDGSVSLYEIALP